MRNGEIISKVREKLGAIETTLMVVSLALALVEFGYVGAELDYQSDIEDAYMPESSE